MTAGVRSGPFPETGYSGRTRPPCMGCRRLFCYRGGRCSGMGMFARGFTKFAQPGPDRDVIMIDNVRLNLAGSVEPGKHDGVGGRRGSLPPVAWSVRPSSLEARKARVPRLCDGRSG